MGTSRDRLVLSVRAVDGGARFRSTIALADEGSPRILAATVEPVPSRRIATDALIAQLRRAVRRCSGLLNTFTSADYRKLEAALATSDRVETGRLLAPRSCRKVSAI